MPQLERYIKAISGVDVCRALVTIPTLLIIFCEREKENEKADGAERRQKRGGMKGMGTANVSMVKLRIECRRRSNSIRGGS